MRNTIDKPPTRVMKKKRNHINIKNEKWDINADSTDIKKIIKVNSEEIQPINT